MISKIGVVGMGYVGIPAALLFADYREFNFVYGFQRNSESSGYKIDMLNRGELPFKGNEPGLKDLLQKVISKKKFECTSDFSKLSDMDAITISIQTPFLNKNDLIPDYTSLLDGVKQIGKNMSYETLVVLESTVTPGTTQNIIKPLLEKESGLEAGIDFYLAHAPERVMVGRLLQNIREHDRVVGGIDRLSTLRACDLYCHVLTKGKIIPMSATAAEVTKTAENTFRDLQIAAVNELALYCEAIGVNIYDVRNGIASLKGEGITRAILYPGAGVGGHCLTKDTYHLERGVKLSGHLDYPQGKDSLYTLARDVNDFMPEHMFSLMNNAMDRVGLKYDTATVVMLGWSFIADSDDTRNTPSEICYNKFIANRTKVMVHDPYVSKYANVTFIPNLEHALYNVDAVIIFTAHNEYKRFFKNPLKVKNLMGKEHPIIIDGRNIIDPDEYINCGFIYKGVGRGDKNNHKLVI